MKIHFLGTISGLWQTPERQHQSFAIEVNKALYIFDAGAGCSRTAQLMGLDLLAVKKVIISHVHMDHVGGLGNLFWDIRKQQNWLKMTQKFGDVRLHIPVKETWDSFLRILRHTEDGFAGITIHCHLVKDGIVFEDENMKVTAFHNRHRGIPEDGNWESFSFLIEAEGKRIVYTGDIKEYSELDIVPMDGCEAAIAETGHHDYMDVCKYMNSRGVKHLFYSHIGRSIMVDYKKAQRDLNNNFNGQATICEDATTFEL